MALRLLASLMRYAPSRSSLLVATQSMVLCLQPCPETTFLQTEFVDPKMNKLATQAALNIALWAIGGDCFAGFLMRKPW